MINWFNNLSPFFQVVCIIAIAATVVMFIQLILLLVGFDNDSAFGGDVPDDVPDVDVINNEGVLDIFGLKVLTIRNLFIFLAMAGWGMLVMYDLTGIIWLSVIVGILLGVGMAFLFAYAMKKAMKLQSSGNIDINNAVGQTGSVYLQIPANKSGFGKVNVLVQDRLQEFNAMTADAEIIPTGVEVTVVSIELNYLIVTKKSN